MLRGDEAMFVFYVWIMNDVVVIKDEIVVAVDTARGKQQVFKGIVKDKMGDPLPGVTILIEGTTIGCATDINGRYSLALSGNAKGVVLVFRFVGMETKKRWCKVIKNLWLFWMNRRKTWMMWL